MLPIPFLFNITSASSTTVATGSATYGVAGAFLDNAQLAYDANNVYLAITDSITGFSRLAVYNTAVAFQNAYTFSNTQTINSVVSANSGLYYTTQRRLLYTTTTASNVTTLIDLTISSYRMSQKVRFLNNNLWTGERSGGPYVKRVSASGSSSTVLETYTFPGADAHYGMDFVKIGDRIWSIGFDQFSKDQLTSISLTNSTYTRYTPTSQITYMTNPDKGNIMATDGTNILFGQSGENTTPATQSRFQSFTVSSSSFNRRIDLGTTSVVYRDMAYHDGFYYFSEGIQDSLTFKIYKTQDLSTYSLVFSASAYNVVTSFVINPDLNVLYYAYPLDGYSIQIGSINL